MSSTIQRISGERSSSSSNCLAKRGPHSTAAHPASLMIAWHSTEDRRKFSGSSTAPILLAASKAIMWIGAFRRMMAILSPCPTP